MSENIDQPSYRCHICKKQDVLLEDSFASLFQVTSDCRPWKRGGKIGTCRSCGFVQKIADDAFISDCKKIYKTYAVYYQADGQEQKVFEQSRGLSLSRSELILTQVISRHPLPPAGTLLDFGCGNGNLLKSFAGICPGWDLSGLEYDESNRRSVESIDRVRSFHSCDLVEVPGTFDMISMIHCLEHMMSPLQFLWTIRQKLHPGGLLLIEIPDYKCNPFDLVIADHCTHFDVGGIRSLLNQCGFETVIVSTEFVPKEITVLARVCGSQKKIDPMTGWKDAHCRLAASLNWLERTIATASGIVERDGCVGIFGTSIAGVWLYSEMPEKVSFFVDEDPARINKQFLSRKVYHPSRLPDDGVVFIPLPHEIAGGISARLKIYGDRFVIPPPLPCID